MQGGLIYEHKHNSDDGKFTVFTVKDNLLFVGCKKGSVIVFDLVNGSFIKQIPFMYKLFKPFYLNNLDNIHKKVIDL